MSSMSEEDEDSEDRKTHLLVAGEEGGLSRVAVTRFMEEFFENTWKQRNRLRCTRDSWVQTEDVATVLPSLAPLASEEEFCSDTELKPKSNLPYEDIVDKTTVDVACSVNISSPCHVRQCVAVDDLDDSVISTQVAVMPGSRDICGRSVIYISVGCMEKQDISATDLAEIILYFQSIPKNETMCLGFLAVIDGRDISSRDAWFHLHKALSLVEETVPGAISLVLALHKSSHKTEILSSKYPIFHLKFEAIVNENQLLKYIAKEQLLPEFSGCYSYHHEEWLNFHRLLDPFVQGCHQMGARLSQLVDELQCQQVPLPCHLMEEQKKRMTEALGDEQLLYLETEGSSLHKKLEAYRDTFSNSADFDEAVGKSKLLYKELQKVAQRLSRLADKRLNRLQESIKIKALEEESSQVLTWLHRKGEETLKKHRTLAETLNAIREQESEFEKFYFLAMRQIERGNDLLEEIPHLTSSTEEKGLSEDLKRHLDDFTDRLEDAREKLEDTSRCYQLLDKTYEWSLETMRFVSHMRVDATGALIPILQKLDSYLQAHPHIEDGAFEEMTHLATKLDNHTLLQQCQTAKAKYEETVQLVTSRQQTLLSAKEQIIFEERPNTNENIDNLKIKPCLWNPLAPISPYRISSQTYLGGPGHGSPSLSSGSYTSFPSSYYPTSFRERLLNLTQRKSHPDFFNKRGSLTDDLVLGRTNDYSSSSHPRKSYCDDYSNLNAKTVVNRPRSLADNNALNASGSESSSSSLSHRKKSYPFSSDDYRSLNAKSSVISSNLHHASSSESSASSVLKQLTDSYNSHHPSSESSACSVLKELTDLSNSHHASSSESSAYSVLKELTDSSSLHHAPSSESSASSVLKELRSNSHHASGSESSASSVFKQLTDSSNSHHAPSSESSASDERSVVTKMEVNSTASSVSSKSYLEDDHNWSVCEAELRKYAGQIREQNRLLEQQKWFTPHDVRNKEVQEGRRQSLASSNPEECSSPVPVNSHLMRCASCSDFEELLSNNALQTGTNNRTLKMILMEMIQTERDYVKSLGYIIENYVPLLQNSNVRQALRSQRNIVFGNIEKIYEFHNCYFLQELEQCDDKPYSVGQCFLKYESQFYLYALYNKNKPKSDSLMAEYGNSFFKKKQFELGDKMDLASYLLKPVQRMGKYALLLKQLLKECPQTNTDQYHNLKDAEEMVRFQLRHGNDLLAMDALRECDVNIKEQGRLLRQEEFVVCQGKSKKALRRVFLFEDLLLLSKARRDHHGNDYYQYKASIKTSDLGLTAQVGESPTKFEMWFRKCKTQDIYVLQAPSPDVKKSWVEEVSGLLWKQAERNRNLRLEEMSSMGIGNKPCLDITPSRDQICDRSISLQQLNKVPRFRNSIAVSSSDNFNNNTVVVQEVEVRRRPLSIGSSTSSDDRRTSSTFYDNPQETEENTEGDKRRSMAQHSQCSAESGIFTDLSTSGDSYVENVRRMQTVERSDSVLSRTSYASVEATDAKDTETSILISSSAAGIEV